MEKLTIPGYAEALAEERKLREEIFLDVPAKLGGVLVNHITPFLLARLSQMRSPFICGGEYNDQETLRFLWALSPDFVTPEHPDCQDRITMLAALLTKRYGQCFVDVEDEIDAFVKATFMDGPMGGGSEQVPYVIGVAWQIHQMGKAPYRWHWKETLHTPLRIIFQLIRCVKLDRGDTMFNNSDWIKDQFLKDFREGKITGLS